MLAVRGLDVYYGDSRVLGDVELTVGRGEVVCVMGRNGVGKTTLLKTVMGLLTPRRGTIEYAGRDLTDVPPYARARLGIGYVPQGRDIFPTITVRENLLVGARQKQPPRAALDYVLSLFPALEGLLTRRGGDLSGGSSSSWPWLECSLPIRHCCCSTSRQRESSRPSSSRLPTYSSGSSVRARRSILLVEQYLEFAWSIGDRFYVMDKGGVALESDRAGLRLDEVTAYLSV